MLRLWLDKGYRPTPVSINVSRMHFNDDHFSGKLLALTDKYHLPRHLLELELTESAFFESEKTLIRVMNDLQKQGFVFSMDDFGTGYSSLSTLRALPFNIVKLDRTFISDGTDNERGQIVARNTVTMARQLKMKIIAEGVETVEQRAFCSASAAITPRATITRARWIPRNSKCSALCRKKPSGWTPASGRKPAAWACPWAERSGPGILNRRAAGVAAKILSC